MAKRGDSSVFVYHWIKSTTSPHVSLQEKYEEAFTTLLLILDNWVLKSGRALGQKYGHSCICFTETPVWFMADDKSKYQPFGFEFYKNDIYKIGGEKVIYCSEEDAKTLPQEHIWKWVRHEPLIRTEQAPYGIDFSWEREVRINRSKFHLLGPSEIVDASTASNVQFAFERIYVPSLGWKERLLDELRLSLDRKLKEDVNNPHYQDYDEFYDSMMTVYSNAIESIS